MTTLVIIGVVSISISLTIIQLLLRKQKVKSEDENKINLAYGILFSTWVICLTLLNLKSINVLDEYVDLIIKTNKENPIKEISKVSVFFIGIVNLWGILWHYISKVFSAIFVANRNDTKEVEKNNYSYFLMKGVILLCLILSLMPVFELLLRMFFPIEIPFYR